MDYGLVGGKYLFTDSTHLKANANKNIAMNTESESNFMTREGKPQVFST